MKNGLKRLVKASCAIMILSALQLNTQAQYSRFELGFELGFSNFLGDLGGNSGKGRTFLKDNMMSLAHSIKGMHLAYRPAEFINFRLSINVGRIGGADSLIKGNGGYEEARKVRNQHFQSPIKEALFLTEFYPTALLEIDPEDVYHRLRPYLVIGVGVFKFNPLGQYVDEQGYKHWVDLKPLRTEGQGMPQYPDRKEYKLTQMNLPYGFGLKYYINEKVSMALEIVNRKTFTDYVDDVSTAYISNEDFYNFFGETSGRAKVAVQMANKTAFANGGVYRPNYGVGSKRGTSSNNDAYYATSIKVNIRLGKGKNSGGYYNSRSNRSEIDCPIVRF